MAHSHFGVRGNKNAVHTFFMSTTFFLLGLPTYLPPVYLLSCNTLI